jgi:polyhydroxybutyrate depolymerase
MWTNRKQRGRTATLAVAVTAVFTLLVAVAGCRGQSQSQGSSPGSSASSASSASPASFPVGSSSHTISVEGVSRSYIVYRPATLPSGASLVVMMHGGYGSASQAEKNYGWDGEADAQHFLVAYPNGLDKAWNAGGGCCGIPAKTGIDDVGFITAMVSTIEQALPVSADHVYATGISNGGIMAYDLACHTTIFAAIGPDSATELGGCPQPTPTSVIHIHGTADTRIPYNGGKGNGSAHIDGPSVPSLNASWRQIDQCPAPTSTTAGVVTTSIANCPGGRTVELITIAGAGHQWPGGKSEPVLQKILQLDTPSTALNATQVIWAFFAAHARVAA